MCGFAGVYRTGSGGLEGLQATVEAMVDPLVHRGPDDEGVWCDEEAGIGLAFRRLAILDLSPHGHQPMRSPSGRFTVVFNGEVYNEKALRTELRDLGWSFRGHSDTEVLLAAFEAWGIPNAVRRFVGMFAIGVWDAEARTLTLIRDRVGIKPLFVHARPGLVAFGSELKALRAAPCFEARVDPRALTTYLRYLYVPAPGTIYRDTVKLPPGHLLTIRDPQSPLPEPECYWDLGQVAHAGRENPFQGTDGEAVDELETLLAHAVALRMRSDVPLGALLSGGIDSTTVVALMQKVSRTPIRTFSIGFNGGEHDESEHAAAVAGWLGTDHTGLQLSGPEALDVLPLMPEIFDEPLGDPSQVPTYLVSRLARRNVTVAMSGDGGDELFGGYNRYIHGARLLHRMMKVPGPARRAVGQGIRTLTPDRWGELHSVLAPFLPASLRHRLAGEKMLKLGSLMQGSSPGAMYRSLISACQTPEDFVVGTAEAGDGLSRALEEDWGGALLGRMTQVDQTWYLPDDLLAKVDRASMARSLEVRVPLLDHRVVEFSWRLPAHLKVREGKGKWILRQVLDRHVPARLVDRPKVGFSVPVASWLSGPLRPWAEDLLAPGALVRGGHLRVAPVRRAWSEFLGGRRELAAGLWGILMFEAWRRRWLP